MSPDPRRTPGPRGRKKLPPVTDPPPDEQPPDAGSFEGWWAYELRGLMWSENPNNGRDINVSGQAIRANEAGLTPLPPDAVTEFDFNKDWPSLPESTGWLPDDSGQPHPRGQPVGFFPFSEIGCLNFYGDPNYTVYGWLRVNNAGFSPPRGHFRGRWRFDAPVMGVYTINLDDLSNHVWDYSFLVLAKDRMLLQVANRLPRPAVGTGILTRLS